MANGWYEVGVEGWLHNGLHYNVGRPSLGVDTDGVLYTIFEMFSDDDRGDFGHDCNYNGEIMLSKSTDSGITWSEPLTLTGTHNIPFEEDDYADETNPSLAEMIDEFLHITYIQTRDGPMDDDFAPGSRIIYHRVALADIPDLDPLPLPREGFKYHNYPPLEVANEYPLPIFFGIKEIYPNPFNSSMIISFSLRREGVITIEACDLNGRLIDRIAAGRYQAGNNSAVWNVGQLTGGVYFIKLSSEEQSEVRKVVALK
ncbi:MAG: T9SS type A sorting domain-containing protein [Calditrichota bacterium]